MVLAGVDLAAITVGNEIGPTYGMVVPFLGVDGIIAFALGRGLGNAGVPVVSGTHVTWRGVWLHFPARGADVVVDGRCGPVGIDARVAAVLEVAPGAHVVQPGQLHVGQNVVEEAAGLFVAFKAAVRVADPGSPNRRPERSRGPPRGSRRPAQSA